MSDIKVDRRIIKTKKVIRNALTELMADKGFDAITVRDLTEKADINRGTFYLHYHDKYDLLAQSEEEVLLKLKEIGLNLKNLNLNDIQFFYTQNQPAPFLIELFEYLQENSDFMNVILGPKGDPSFQVKIKEVIRQNIIQNLFIKLKKEDMLVPVDMFIAYVTSAHLGVIQQWLNSGMKQTPYEISLILFNLTVQGPRASIGL
ncbi:TetR/AcrR family transcriptional regulator [Viridibacillus arvi]|uniref:TetR/AcrR family transcriptional regulator n=1 Tax=Viridibacillus arvi TaxID=263475 RepID=UPI0036ACFC15